MASSRPAASARRLRALADRRPEIAKDLHKLADDVRAEPVRRRLRQKLSAYRLIVQSPFGRVYRLLKR